jgi:hypothetical protein
MEDNRKVPERTLLRGFEGNRLEEQVWAMAYEHIWPLVYKTLKRQAELRQRQPDTKNHMARRA